MACHVKAILDAQLVKDSFQMWRFRRNRDVSPVTIRAQKKKKPKCNKPEVLKL